MAKAFDFSQDAAKQLITLSTGVLALTITFYKDFAPNAGHGSKTLMAIGWGLFLLSVTFGVFGLFMLTGALAPKEDKDKPPTVHHKNSDIASGLQQLTFLGGLVLTVIAGILAL